MKKTIIGLSTGLVALGGVSAPEVAEVSREYSINQVQEIMQKKDYTKKRNSDVLERVYFGKKNVLFGVPEFKHKGWTISVLEKEVVSDNLKVKITAQMGDKTISDTITFVNPPIKVPNGKKIKQKDELGIETEIDEFEINPKEALKEIIVQTLNLKK